MAKYLVVITRSWPVTQKLPLALHKLVEGLFFFFFFGTQNIWDKGSGAQGTYGVVPLKGALTNSKKGTKLCA